MKSCPLSLAVASGLSSSTPEYEAVRYFFTNNAKCQSPEESRSLIEYLPALYSAEPGSFPLKCTITATALAALSGKRYDPGMLAAAHAFYSLALQETNEALRDPKSARSDETLISVVLLGFYEVSFAVSIPGLRN